jgi:hypothetical protein
MGKKGVLVSGVRFQVSGTEGWMKENFSLILFVSLLISRFIGYCRSAICCFLFFNWSYVNSVSIATKLGQPLC